MPRLVIKSVLALAALFGGWSALWFWGTERLTSEITNWMANEKSHGRDIACQTLDRTGYPFRLTLTCTGFSFNAPTARGTVALTLPRLTANAMVWDPKTIVAQPSSPLVIAENGSAPLKAEWSSWQTSARVRLDGFFDETTTRIDDIKVQPPEGGLAAHARHFAITLRVNAQTPDTLDAMAQALGLVIPVAPQPLGPADVAIEASALKAIDYQRRPVIRHLRAWQQAGGSLDLKALRILNEPSLLTAKGQMTLSNDGRPNGQVTIEIAELASLVDKLGLAQKINPMALAAMNLLGRPVTIEGRNARAYPLAFKDGQLQAGPVKLPMPSLWQ